ncbi:arabinofuranosidase catalytic domain-containing protein [Micromonospora sp. DT31]|uniref:arabinofuranosidase catalytic domain-containing protein n=1 Tax=Micromonospora sp. DT31 TaxID=3393434 RepID=UPI003CF53C61
MRGSTSIRALPETRVPEEPSWSSPKGSNAQAGSLFALYDGSLPPDYSPMRKQGAIILGSGGDCCRPGGGANLSAGTFYEGAMVSGYPSDATENAVQADIVATGYR